MVEIFDESCLELKSSWATIIVRVVEILSKSPYYLNEVAWRYSLGGTSLPYFHKRYSHISIVLKSTLCGKLNSKKEHIGVLGSHIRSYLICRKFTR